MHMREQRRHKETRSHLRFVQLLAVPMDDFATFSAMLCNVFAVGVPRASSWSVYVVLLCELVSVLR